VPDKAAQDDIFGLVGKLKSLVFKPTQKPQSYPPRIAAGLLMYRLEAGNLDVFLVRPGGPYYTGMNKGIWSVPKGTVEKGENIKQAAIREFHEETGIVPQGQLIELGPVAIRANKIVHAWAFEGDVPKGFRIRSNTFTLDGKQYPEVDDGRFFSIKDAFVYIYPGQKDFLRRLAKKIGM
jgi:predicted NUDIX family NTP pyrophosphohydrolase